MTQTQPTFCSQCMQPIHPAAQRCPHCRTRTDWRRIQNIRNWVIALAIGAVLLVGGLWVIAQPGRSDACEQINQARAQAGLLPQDC